MPNTVDTGAKLVLIETDDINKVPFKPGQYIIVDNSMVYYDPTTGTSLENRQCLTPRQEVDVFERQLGKTDSYYLYDVIKNPIDGDLAIIKDTIPNTNKYQYTIYIYNDNPEDTNDQEWRKLTESYLASNIYIDSDIKVTSQLNGVEPITVEKGSSIMDLFEVALSPDKYPNIEMPSLKATLSVKDEDKLEFSAGTVVKPILKIEFNPGSYEYGPETGVTVTGGTIVDSNGISYIFLANTFNANGFIGIYELEDLEIKENTNYNVSIKLEYGEGCAPNTFKGNVYSSGSIRANTIDASSSTTIIGYLPKLYYGTSNLVGANLITEETITSEQLKSLSNVSSTCSENTFPLDIPKGTSSIIVAHPSDSEHPLDNVILKTFCTPMLEAFGEPVNKLIPIANNLNKEYTVYIYNPAEPYVNSTSVTIILK